MVSDLVEEGYHENNPYHNVIHAADVTQAMHCYLKEQKVSWQHCLIGNHQKIKDKKASLFSCFSSVSCQNMAKWFKKEPILKSDLLLLFK